MLQLTATAEEEATARSGHFPAAGTYIFRIQEANADKTVSGISMRHRFMSKLLLPITAKELIAALQYKSEMAQGAIIRRTNT